MAKRQIMTLSSSVLSSGEKREKQRDRETEDRGTDGQRDIGTDGQRNRGKAGQRESGTEGQREIGTERKRDRRTDGQRGQTCAQREKSHRYEMHFEAATTSASSVTISKVTTDVILPRFIRVQHDHYNRHRAWAVCRMPAIANIIAASISRRGRAACP